MNCLDVEALVSLLLLSSNSSLNPLLAEESCWSEFCLLSQTCTPEQIDNVCKLASDHQGNNVIEVVPENNHDIVRRNTKSSGKDFMVAIIQEFSLEKVTIIFEEEKVKRNQMEKDFKLLSANGVYLTTYIFEKLESDRDYQNLFSPVADAEHAGTFLLFSFEANLEKFLKKADQNKLFWNSGNSWFLQGGWQSTLNGISWKQFLTQTNIYLPLNVQFYVTVPSSGSQTGNVVLHEAYHRGAEGFPLESKEFGSWSSTSGLITVQQHLWERRNDLRGVFIRASTMDDMPFVDLKPLSPGSKHYRLIGYLADVWTELQIIMGFNYSVIASVDGKWGALNDDGVTFNGVVGMIERGDIDVGVASFFATSDRAKAGDFSVALYNSLAKLFVKTPTPYAGWLTFINPFTWQVWAFTGASLVLQSMALAFTQWWKKEMTGEEKDEPTILTCARALCQQGASKEPVRYSTRIVFITMFFCAIVIFNSYGASLTSFLAVVKVNFPFKSIEELYRKTDIRVGVVKDSVFDSIFRHAKEGVMADIYQNQLSQMSGVKEGVERLKYDPDFSFLFQEESIDYMDDQPCQIVTTPETIIVGKMVMIFRKKFPYTAMFNHYLSQMRERGQLSQMWNRWKPLPQKDCFEVTEATGIDFDKFKSLVVFFLISVGVSCLLALYEKFSYPKKPFRRESETTIFYKSFFKKPKFNRRKSC